MEKKPRRRRFDVTALKWKVEIGEDDGLSEIRSRQICEILAKVLRRQMREERKAQQSQTES